MTIRPYAPHDADAVLDIWHAASRVGHPFLSDQELQRQRDVVREVYLTAAEIWVATALPGCGASFGSETAGFPVDEEQTTVLGFIGLLESFIGGLFIAPWAHRRGTGGALVRHAATLKGELTVEVFAANTGALAFYQRCGFVETGRRLNDDPHCPFPLVQLRRPA